ncbi:putative F-box protein PP2-B12 [Elaeis guineensis]|uniref:F-box protein PP2-B12 n=1 Tax=Elaeis guineensis var. tenera TaxID=51953 RepID=A0A6I9SA48_ELAGV|nr:putative F-box protein PP2-B12 [Elaeis guineensis]XP_010935984.1 putative F-box protein PP2-B12 [Elaeis guineensis]
MGTGCGDICALPEGCISDVISLTSPVDACRSAAVCTTFRSAAVSDTVWERFLPPDYRSILSRAVQPVEYSSKKELFFRLCESILIDDGKMSFSLEKSSGAKCYMLSARQIFIVWGDTPEYWIWHPLPESRFSEVAELVDVCWLEIRGKIESSILTPKTTYAAYLIFKADPDSGGLGFVNQETTVKLGAQVSAHTVNVQPIVSGRPRYRHRLYFLNQIWDAMLEEHADAEENKIAARAPQSRADGWMEMEMGEFYNDEGEDGEVEMNLMEVKGGHWKSGLIIQGIEIRPKK